MFQYDYLFDSHSHLSTIEGDTTDLVHQATSSGVMKIVDIANDVASTKKVLALNQTFPEIVLPTAGIHPELAVPGSDLYFSGINETVIKKQVSLLDEIILSNPNKFTMIGETGLDYYWLEKSTLSKAEIDKSKELQKILFEKQILLAQKHNLPMSVHTRSSHQDCIQLVKKYPDVKGIFHSFTGRLEEAKEIFDLGYAIGINGIITYKSAQVLRETILSLTEGKNIHVPSDLYACNIYLETDSPFLIPSNIKVRPLYNSPQNILVLWDFIYNLLNHR